MHESEKCKWSQLCPTLHDPVDCSLPGSSVHGIFQARVLEWGAIAFRSSCVFPKQWKWKSLSFKFVLFLSFFSINNETSTSSLIWKTISILEVDAHGDIMRESADYKFIVHYYVKALCLLSFINELRKEEDFEKEILWYFYYTFLPTSR